MKIPDGLPPEFINLIKAEIETSEGETYVDAPAFLAALNEIKTLRARIEELEQEVYSTNQVCNIALTANDALMETIAKDDPMRRIYDEGIPVMVCMWCGATRQQFQNEVKHADDCVWKLARVTK